MAQQSIPQFERPSPARPCTQLTPFLRARDSLVLVCLRLILQAREVLFDESLTVVSNGLSLCLGQRCGEVRSLHSKNFQQQINGFILETTLR